MGAEKKWMYTLFFTAFISVLLFLSTPLGFTASYYSFSTYRSYPSTVRVRSRYPPAFAYYITGGRGDGSRILRLLMAVYHPRNQYMLHIDAEGSDDERMRFVVGVRAVPDVSAFGNVDVVGKPDRLTYMVVTHVAATLRAVANRTAEQRLASIQPLFETSVRYRIEPLFQTAAGLRPSAV